MSRQSSRATVAALALCFGVFAPRAGNAEEPVVWNGPKDCPGADELKAKLADLIPEGLPDDLVLRVDVTPKDGRFAFRLELRGALSGDRQLESAGCDELPQTAALLVLLSLDENQKKEPPASSATASEEPAPDPIERTPEPIPPPETTPSTPPPPLEPAAKPAAADSPPSRSDLLVGLGLIASTPWYGSLNPGVLASVGVRVERLEVNLTGSAFLPQTYELADAPVGAELFAGSGRLRAAYALVRKPVRLAPYVAVEAMSLIADGYGSVNDRQSSDWFPALHGGGEVEVPVSERFAVRFALGLVWIPKPPRLALSPGVVLHEVETLGLQLEFEGRFRTPL